MEQNDANNATQSDDLAWKLYSESRSPVVILLLEKQGLRVAVKGDGDQIAQMVFSLLADNPALEDLVVPALLRRRMLRAGGGFSPPSVN